MVLDLDSNISKKSNLNLLTQIQRDVRETNISGNVTTGDFCKIYNTANLATSGATELNLTFNSEENDASNLHSVSVDTERITLAVGKWLIIGICPFILTGLSREGTLRLYEGGTEKRKIVSGDDGANADETLTIVEIISITSDSFVKLTLTDTSSSTNSLTIIGGQSGFTLTAIKIG
jgi:hypothetical protein